MLARREEKQFTLQDHAYPAIVHPQRPSFRLIVAEVRRSMLCLGCQEDAFVDFLLHQNASDFDLVSSVFP